MVRRADNSPRVGTTITPLACELPRTGLLSGLLTDEYLEPGTESRHSKPIC